MPTPQAETKRLTRKELRAADEGESAFDEATRYVPAPPKVQAVANQANKAAKALAVAQQHAGLIAQAQKALKALPPPHLLQRARKAMAFARDQALAKRRERSRPRPRGAGRPARRRTALRAASRGGDSGDDPPPRNRGRHPRLIERGWQWPPN